MRTLLLASAALLLAGGAAVAQNAAGNPKSGTASNTDQANTHSELAPALPSAGATGTSEEYLQRAERAVKANRTGEAQEALERAETRALDRSTAVDAASQPDTSPRVTAIRKALMALGHRDRKGAMDAIQMAMSAPGDAGGAMPMPAASSAPAGEPMGTMPMPAAGSGPASANGVPVNPAGGTNLPEAGNQGSSPLPPKTTP